MSTRKTVLFLVFFLAIGRAVLFAQAESAAVSSEFEGERVKIPPTVAGSEVSLQNSTAAGAVPGRSRQPAPVRHLWADVDGDGLLDLTVIDPTGSRLFHNRGKGGFDDVTGVAFPDGLPPAVAGSWGDYDSDERPDLFLFLPEGFRLFRNEGRFRFADVTEDLGLDPALTVSTVRLNDIDGDGCEDLLVQTPDGERIFRNRDSRSFERIALVGMGEGSTECDDSPGSESSVRAAGIAADRLPSAGSIPGRTAASVPPYSMISSPVSRSTQKSPSSFNEAFLNDNSPGSIGIDVPEVEGGDDVTKPRNDIVDGTITGSDIEDDSVPASKISGTAATLSGNQNFDSGTFYIDAADNSVGIGTTDPTDASLHVESSAEYGCRVENDSATGGGVSGIAPQIGVRGESTATTDCVGGVTGRGNSDEGMGVFGLSPFVGVYGWPTTSSGENFGVRGDSESPDGYGVRGWNAAETGTACGVKGMSSSTSGRGVYGASSYIGVYGISTASSGTSMGVYGWSSSSSGRATYGYASSSTGTNYGVRGYTASSDGYGVYSAGDFGCSGVKSFVQPHPKDASKEIRFVCLEGNESGTYFRGSARLQGGRAVIEVPEEFRLVSGKEGLTVQVTPLGPGRIWVEARNLNRIVVRGDNDVEFDYFVNGVRRGFGEFEPIRENRAWVPEYKDKPFGTQYPAALRRILVENGILKSDFTPDEKTAAMMGWELRDFADDIPLPEKAETGKPPLFDRAHRGRHALK